MDQLSPPYALYTPEEMATKLAAKLKSLRLNLGWKQSTLAERSGVSLASLRRLEGSGQGSLTNLLRLVFALGRIDDFADILQPPPARSIAELERLSETPKRQRGSL